MPKGKLDLTKFSRHRKGGSSCSQRSFDFEWYLNLRTLAPSKASSIPSIADRQAVHSLNYLFCQSISAIDNSNSQSPSEGGAQYVASNPDAQVEQLKADASYAEAKQCATWQDFVAYEQQHPKTPELALPVPPARFANGCITEDATGSALNIFITENGYDNGIPMPETPDDNLLFGFIPSVVAGRNNQTDESSSRPERMHIGFSSRISLPETTEGYYEVRRERIWPSILPIHLCRFSRCA